MASSPDVPYTRGLHRLAEHCHAWLVPDGTSGWNNAGLVTGAGESLLVDTLFDLAMTREMLDGLRPVTDEQPIRTVVNTHANGDHWFGNELLVDAEIIASQATFEEMETNGPDLIRGRSPSRVRSAVGFDGSSNGSTSPTSRPPPPPAPSTTN